MMDAAALFAGGCALPGTPDPARLLAALAEPAPADANRSSGEDEPSDQHFRTIFISDLHLGTPALFGTVVRPVSLFVGRVSYEKNIDAFLKLDIPGTKVVCGVGPLEAQLKERYPQVRWLGVLPRDALARVYAAADVFVFPSRSETFGLAMLEAIATGTPVAAFPVDGPLEVVGLPDGSQRGGCCTRTSKPLVTTALAVPCHEARARAMRFSGEHAAQLFKGFLVPSRRGPQGEARLLQNGVKPAVTPLSSNQ